MKLRRACKALGAIAAVLLLFVLVTGAWMLWWPAPKSVTAQHCDATPRCRVIEGRVIYILAKDRASSDRPLHLVLVSRQSGTAPGISVVKVPVELRPARNLRVGSWVSVRGTPHRGSNGEQTLGVDAISTSVDRAQR